MATLRPLFSLGNKLFLRPANKGSGFLSMVQQHSNTTEDDSKKGGTDSKKGEKDSQKIIIPVDNDSLTRAVQKFDRKNQEINAWGVLKEGLAASYSSKRKAENSALSPKIDQKKPKINSSLLQKFEKQISALSLKFNQPLSKNGNQNKPYLVYPKKTDQKKPELNSDLSQKVDQKKPEINSTLTQKVDQKKPEKNSAYPVETELYYPNKTVSVSSTTLNLTSTMNVTEQLKGTILKLFQS